MNHLPFKRIGRFAGLLEVSYLTGFDNAQKMIYVYIIF